MIIKYERTFLGTGWSFPPRFIKGKGMDMVSGEADIKESLFILFSTTPGERIFRFDYGCNLRQWVFEEMSLANETLAVESIKQAILMYEPRIDVEQVALEIRDELEGIVWISVDFRIRETNSRSNMVYPYYFKEGTNL